MVLPPEFFKACCAIHLAKQFLYCYFFQDVGGGWLEGKNSQGERGLVPTDYVEVSDYTALQ